MRIAVVYGGESAEREVSLRSGSCVCEALSARGHEVLPVLLEGAYPEGEALAHLVRAEAVFLALHGGAGEDGRLQAYLEARGIRHYTGSGPAASALAMDKVAAKARVAAHGIPVARGVCLLGGVHERGGAPLPFPFVIKPCRGGSSIGISRVSSDAEWRALPRFAEPMLCEELLSGEEYSVAVLEGKALPPVQICPVNGWYDYAHKYEAGATRELCPAPVGKEKLRALCALAERGFRALELRDLARIDFKENARGEPIFLEANTLPGMTKTSLFPLAAATAGLSCGAFCERVAALAAKRRDVK